jgi:hypothetical protein
MRHCFKPVRRPKAGIVIRVLDLLICQKPEKELLHKAR